MDKNISYLAYHRDKRGKGQQKTTMEIFVDVRPLLHMNQQLNLATIEVIVVTIELVVVTIELIVVNMHFFR
jgi:hypothetical protein